MALTPFRGTFEFEIWKNRKFTIWLNKTSSFLNIFYPLEKLQIFTSNKPQSGEKLLPYGFDLEKPQDLFYFTATIRKKNQLKWSAFLANVLVPHSI